MTRIKMISADGGTEIEVNDDRVEHFERKGYTTAGAGMPASVSHKPKAIKAEAIDETHDAIEKTAMGDSYRSFKTGLLSWSGSIECWWDETDTSGQGALNVGASVTLNLYPEGATTGDIFYSGTALISGKTINASADGMVEASYSVQGSGGLTESTA